MSKSREHFLRIASGSSFDIVIIGGGIHGACAAREAALFGYSVLLLEAHDFAFGTSSRSSKMLHGGIRYLESGDIKLVKEALEERGLVLKNAPHLSRVEKFLYPIIKHQTRPAWQVKLGLKLYDFFSHDKKLFPRSGEASAEEAEILKDFGLKSEALLYYYDGQMNDARLVIENILDASQHGAVTLNYAPVTSFKRRAQKWEVTWRDVFSKEHFNAQGSFLLNLAGPWIPALHSGHVEWKKHWPKPLLSRGTHLLFNKPWPTAGVILPTGEKNRYYFIWPYFSPFGNATLVGTTDTEVNSVEEDPVANEKEISELLSFVRRDVPAAELNEKSLYKTFCGLRLLAAKRMLFSKGSGKSLSASRYETFLEDDHYVALLGGKFTNARLTAELLVRIADKKLSRKLIGKKAISKEKPLPGAESFSNGKIEEIKKALIEVLKSKLREDEKTSETILRCEVLAERATKRFGMRAEKLVVLERDEHEAEFYMKSVLRSEILISQSEEFTCREEDVTHRRLGLDFEYVA